MTLLTRTQFVKQAAASLHLPPAKIRKKLPPGVSVLGEEVYSGAQLLALLNGSPLPPPPSPVVGVYEVSRQTGVLVMTIMRHIEAGRVSPLALKREKRSSYIFSEEEVEKIREMGNNEVGRPPIDNAEDYIYENEGGWSVQGHQRSKGGPTVYSNKRTAVEKARLAHLTDPIVPPGTEATVYFNTLSAFYKRIRPCTILEPVLSINTSVLIMYNEEQRRVRRGRVRLNGSPI